MIHRILIGFLTSGFACCLALFAMGQTSETKSTTAPDRVVVETTSVPEADFDQAFRHLKSQDQLQFELADAPPPPKVDWLTKFLKPIFNFLGNLLPLFEILFWVFLASGAGLILYIIGMALWNFRRARLNREKGAAQSSPLYRPSGERARILLAAVDALAAEGRFAEAVHQLLFRSVQDLALARPNMIRRSYTSREIAGLSELTPDTRTAFSLIASEVERSHFGGRSLDEAVFLRCRNAYAQFAVPELGEDAPAHPEGVRV